jgi:hypothetical protein
MPPDRRAVLDELAALELWPVNRPAWLAWGQLSGSRAIGFGVGPIPLSEIVAWFALKRRPVSGRLVEKILAIDGEYLAVTTEREESKRERERRRGEARQAARGAPHRPRRH